MIRHVLHSSPGKFLLAFILVRWYMLGPSTDMLFSSTKIKRLPAISKQVFSICLMQAQDMALSSSARHGLVLGANPLVTCVTLDFPEESKKPSIAANASCCSFTSRLQLFSC